MSKTFALLLGASSVSAFNDRISTHDPEAFWRSLPWAVVSMMVWWVVFWLANPVVQALSPSWHRAIDQTKHKDLSARVVGLVHALVCCPVAIIALMQAWQDPAFMTEPLFNYNPYSQLAIMLSCGYFMWDVAVCIIYGWGYAFLFHGATCACLYLMASNSFLHLAAPFFLLFEMSTPFLHVRWLLIQLKMTDTMLFKFVNLGFAGMFFLARLVVGLPVSWLLVIKPCTAAIAAGRFVELGVPAWHGYAEVGGMAALDVLNVFWFAQMVKSATTKRDGKKKD